MKDSIHELEERCNWFIDEYRRLHVLLGESTAECSIWKREATAFRSYLEKKGHSIDQILAIINGEDDEQPKT